MSRTFSINFVPYATQRPEFQGQQIQITENEYATFPSWHIPQTNLTIALNISTIQSIISFNAVNLVELNTWHVNNASSIYSTFIPNRYNYLFDGTTSTSISDGGSDMYDGGNFISISTTRNLINIFSRNNNEYGLISTVQSQNFGFFITSRNVWPQVSLAYIQNGNILWRLTGGIGTDGGGSLSNISSTYITPRGFTGRFWANQGFGTGDPTICYTWFTIESTSWNSLVSSSNIGMATTVSPPDPMNQFVSVSGQNFMFGVFLLSTRRVVTPLVGQFISTNFIEAFLSDYVQNANIIVS